MTKKRKAPPGFTAFSPAFKRACAKTLKPNPKPVKLTKQDLVVLEWWAMSPAQVGVTEPRLYAMGYIKTGGITPAGHAALRAARKKK